MDSMLRSSVAELSASLQARDVSSVEVATAVLELKPDGGYDYFPGEYEDFLYKTGKIERD